MKLCYFSGNPGSSTNDVIFCFCHKVNIVVLRAAAILFTKNRHSSFCIIQCLFC